MTTRRDFLKGGTTAAAGLVFCSCGMLQSARAQQPTRQKIRSWSMASKSRPSTSTPTANSAKPPRCLATKGQGSLVAPVRGAEQVFLDMDQRLAAMDIQAVDMEVL